MTSTGDDIVITDIEYRDKEYILFIDETRAILPGEKSIKYLGTFQNIEKEENIRFTGVYLRKLTGTEVCVVLYK